MSTDAALDRIGAALAELRRLRCGDPAAASANAALRLTAHTLEVLWLPALGAERADPADQADQAEMADRRTWSEDAGRRNPVDLGAAEQPRQA